MTLAADMRRAINPAALAGVIGMVPDPWQVDVLKSQHPRILINGCRQSGKSSTASVLGVHAAVYEPRSTVLLLSPSLRQSSELFRKCRQVYRAIDRPVAEAESALSLTLANGSRLVCLPGNESTVRGYSAVRLLLVDEASRVPDELMAAIRPMLAVSGGRIVAMSTPAGRRGWWSAAWHSSADWKRVKIAANQCPRITPEFLAEEEQALGTWLFRQEYLGEFTEGAEQVFRDDDLKAMVSARVRPLPGGWD